MSNKIYYLSGIIAIMGLIVMPLIDKKFDIETWTENEIINKLPKAATYTLNFVALVDLRKIFCHKTVDQGVMVFDVLVRDPSFIEKFLLILPKENISPKEVVEGYLMGDIITLNIDKNVIIKLNEHSEDVFNNLNCKNVLDLWLVPESSIQQEIQKVIGDFDYLTEVTKNIIHNSKVLYEVSY